MENPKPLFSSIEQVVNSGKAVVSADDSVIVAMMLEALRNGRSVTFYTPPEQAQAVGHLFWTPRRIKELGMEAVSKEERYRIEAELGVKDMGPWFSNRIECPQCEDGVYGAFEFMKQGLLHHGKDWVGAVVELKNTTVMRINPSQEAFCPLCNHVLLAAHNYAMYGGPPDRQTLSYGCCSSDIAMA